MNVVVVYIQVDDVGGAANYLCVPINGIEYDPRFGPSPPKTVDNRAELYGAVYQTNIFGVSTWPVKLWF